MLRNRVDIRIPLIYTIISVLWILFSDMAIYAMYPELQDVHTASVVKGLGFVFLTGLMLFVLLNRERNRNLKREQEKQRLDEERRDALARLRLHIERMPMGYIVTDRQFRFVSVNPGAERIFGYADAELQGRSPYGLIIPEEAKGFVEEIRRQWMEGSLEAHGTNENLTKDGRRIICDWFNTPVMDNEGRFDRLISIVQDVTDRRQAAQVIENSRVQLRALTARLDLVREEERVNLSREIHDGLGQLLTAMKIDLSLLRRLLTGEAERDAVREPEASARETGGEPKPDARKHEPVRDILVSLDGLTDQTISQTRDLARRLRSGALQDVILSDAIRELAQETLGRAGVRHRLVLPQHRLRISHRQRLALYRIAQEALTNVIRHARATHVDLSLTATDGRILLEVADDGIGVSNDGDSDTLGLVGMRERAEMFGGHARILPRPDSGTIVHVEMPMASEADDTGNPERGNGSDHLNL